MYTIQLKDYTQNRLHLDPSISSSREIDKWCSERTIRVMAMDTWLVDSPITYNTHLATVFLLVGIVLVLPA